MEIDNSSSIDCQDAHITASVKIGPDVHISCSHLRIAHGVTIGLSENSDFRSPGGVKIEADSLTLGENVSISRNTLLLGGDIRLDANVRIKDWSTINVRKLLKIGANGTVGSHCEVAGVDIKIGRRLWMLPYAKIGGGSAFDFHSSFEAGHFLHIGMYSILNTARKITIGDEVGLGTRTALYTHGAYATELAGFPVAFGEISIGDRTWIPGAVVNPGVSIGSDCVIGVGSVVTRDLPDACLAAGIPAKVLKENYYPRQLSHAEKREIISGILKEFVEIWTERPYESSISNVTDLTLDGRTRIIYQPTFLASELDKVRNRGEKELILLADSPTPCGLKEGETFLDLNKLIVDGQVSDYTERLMNQLRRHGIRFRCEAVDGHYQMWG